MRQPRRAIGSFESYNNIQSVYLGSLRDEVEGAIADALAKWGKAINCFTLHLELKTRFPRAIMWASPDHVMTEIDGLMFDRDGLRFARQVFTDAGTIKKCFNTWPKINDF